MQVQENWSSGTTKTNFQQAVRKVGKIGEHSITYSVHERWDFHVSVYL